MVIIVSYQLATGQIRSARATNIARAYSIAMNSAKPVNITAWIEREDVSNYHEPNNFVCYSKDDVFKAFAAITSNKKSDKKSDKGTAMKLKKFFEMLDKDSHYRTDYIVRLKYKYDWEKEYTIENEYLEYDSNNDCWVWLNDWNEGQTDVEVLGYIDIDDIYVPAITCNKENCDDS